MVLVRPTVENKNRPVIVLLPGKHLGGGVEEVVAADGVVADVDLGIAAVEHEGAAQLRNLNVSAVRRVHGQAVGRRIRRVILRMPTDISAPFHTRVYGEAYLAM